MATNIPPEESHTPHTPEKGEQDVTQPGTVAEREMTHAAALMASFIRPPTEPIERSQERLVDEVLIPALERGPLADAQVLVTEIVGVLEPGLPTAAQAHSWHARANDIVERTSNLLHAIQRSTGEALGAASAFAMAEIAHHCPKYLHMYVSPYCKSLAAALDAENRPLAEKCRELILTELGGTGTIDTRKRYESLLEGYSISRACFFEEFSKAEEAIFAPGSFVAITGQVERHFHDVIHHVLNIEHHQYQIEFSTPQPTELQTEPNIPNAGLIVEVLSELVTNALKVMEQKKTGSKLLVTIIPRSNGSVQLMVRDDGPGIGEMDPKKLFEPRMTTTQGFGGTGMGLTYLRANLKQYFGASIRAEKNEEDDQPGMTFTCVIPPTQKP